MSNLDVFMILLTFAIVGLFIGLSGIGGFIIPIVLINVVRLELTEALVYTFIAFLLSGFMGFWSYYKAKAVPNHLILKTMIPIMIGSILGVFISSGLNESVVKTLLYLIALGSGLFMLQKQKQHQMHAVLETNVFWIVIGFVVGLVCSIAGVGGALILVPVLTVLGFPMRSSVGLGILASIFVSLPASIGYLIQSTNFSLNPVFVLGFLLHILFVLVGFKLALFIKQRTLKLTIGVITVCSSIYLLVQLYL